MMEAAFPPDSVDPEASTKEGAIMLEEHARVPDTSKPSTIAIPPLAAITIAAPDTDRSDMTTPFADED
jgi:hypothetical protein